MTRAVRREQRDLLLLLLLLQLRSEVGVLFLEEIPAPATAPWPWQCHVAGCATGMRKTPHGDAGHKQLKKLQVQHLPLEQALLELVYIIRKNNGKPKI